MFSVLVSEGYKAPFLAIIKSGEAHVLRQLEVLQTLPNRKKVGTKLLRLMQLIDTLRVESVTVAAIALLTCGTLSLSFLLSCLNVITFCLSCVSPLAGTPHEAGGDGQVDET